MESSCDLIALGWSQELSADRAPVVRETLARANLPVLLVPVLTASENNNNNANNNQGGR